MEHFCGCTFIILVKSEARIFLRGTTLLNATVTRTKRVKSWRYYRVTNIKKISAGASEETSCNAERASSVSMKQIACGIEIQEILSQPSNIVVHVEET